MMNKFEKLNKIWFIISLFLLTFNAIQRFNVENTEGVSYLILIIIK